MARREGLFTWMGFLAMAFVVTGLAGVFATYAAPLPLERLLARDQALSEADADADAPDVAARLAALAPRLGEDAAALAPGPGLAARIARLRAADRARFLAEAAATRRALRLLVITVTGASLVFGLLVLSVAGR